jgi:hypothetical protein
MRRYRVCTVTSAAVLLLSMIMLARADDQDDQLIPRRSSQVHDGFGINADLPRDPFIPWNRWWWTRMFDTCINFIRIGQYENSSDYKSWDWVERRRGEYSVDPNLDDYVDSLRENGVHIEIQLLYGNPLYTSPVARAPEVISPEPGSFHNPDRSLYSVFWPPKTAEQVEAFARYVTWMVKHFSGRVEYYEIWNKPNIEYWNPVGNPEDYGKLFKAAAAIHNADPNAKAVFGGLAGADLQYAKRPLDACACAASIDVFAYHNYPGYGHNLNPEAPSEDFDTNSSSRPLREMVRHYPGVKQDLPFWDDEFNDGIASWKGSDESVQGKYVPRGLLIDRAEGVRTFVWLIVGATDGNEFDDFGILRGMRYPPDDFAPRPVFSAINRLIPRWSVGSGILFQLGFCWRLGEAPSSFRTLARSTRRAEPPRSRYCLSHFRLRRATSKAIGSRSVESQSCADAPFVSAIQSSGMARRRKQAHDEDHDWIQIRRGLCNLCGKTFTFLPPFSPPYGHYSLIARSQALRRYFLEDCSWEAAAPLVKDPDHVADSSLHELPSLGWKF